MGLNTSPIGELEFTDCRVPKENLIGKPGGSFFMLETVMTWEILCIFIMMVGEMQRRHEECIRFAKKRSQFGAPIGTNQYIAGKIVDQKIGLENSRMHSLRDRSTFFAGTQRGHGSRHGEARDERGEPRVGIVGRGRFTAAAVTCAKRASRKSCEPPSARPSTRARMRCSASGLRRCSASSGRGGSHFERRPMSTEAAVITVPTHVLEYLRGQMKLTLATASTTGVPRAGAFMFVNVGPLIYFWTRPETTIAKQIAQNPVVAFTVDDYVEDWSKTKGIQGSGECRVILASAEIINVVRAFSEKYPNVHSSGETTNISFYRITPDTAAVHRQHRGRQFER